VPENNAKKLAVIDALTRDAQATLSNAEIDLRAYVQAEADRLSVYVDNGDFEQKLVDDFQQRMHDEFIDVCWPRCPHHPNHPLWFEDGAWRCLRTKIVFAPLGGLTGANSAE